MARLASPSMRPLTYSPMLYAQPEDRVDERLLEDLALSDEPLVLDPLDEEPSDTEGQEFAEGAVHIEGVPRSNIKLDARRYTTNSFSAQLLQLFGQDLALDGWTDFPEDMEATHITIKKVSGALTNAVFFVSCPSVSPPPPTVLLRVYGPSSGSLISRKQELQLLHVLSTSYAIGPAVLGTFENGRVEQYFRSRALHKEELRDPRINKWIARRMRELHTVKYDALSRPEPSPGWGDLDRPSFRTRNASSSSLQSDTSSVFSFSSSGSAASSLKSTSFRRSLTPGGLADAARFGEVPAPRKRRSRASVRLESSHSIPRTSSAPGSKERERLGVWDNITRWTRESAKVFKAISNLTSLPGATDKPTNPGASPLSSPSALLAWKDSINLPLFEEQVKAYRHHVTAWEKAHGKSKRGLAHNDTQYGNLLIRLAEGVDANTKAGDIRVEPDCEHPHEMLIVVDFEYASWNPRGYDIANHFVEWQADYHHPSLSYSLAVHLAYPTLEERRTFYRAYLGIDNGKDDESSDLPPLEEESDRVLRMEEEVRLWQPATYASWANWAIVQARDEIIHKIEEWQAHPDAAERANDQLSTTPVQQKPIHLQRNKSGDLQDMSKHGGELVLPTSEPEAEFDYMLFAQEKMDTFRKAIGELQS